MAIRLVSKEERARTAYDFIVCRRLEGGLLLPDNLTGVCCDCRHLIQYRPDILLLLPPKICMQCALDRVQGGSA